MRMASYLIENAVARPETDPHVQHVRDFTGELPGGLVVGALNGRTPEVTEGDLAGPSGGSMTRGFGNVNTGTSCV
jgi:hypothetical protein